MPHAPQIKEVDVQANTLSPLSYPNHVQLRTRLALPAICQKLSYPERISNSPITAYASRGRETHIPTSRPQWPAHSKNQPARGFRPSKTRCGQPDHRWV